MIFFKFQGTHVVVSAFTLWATRPVQQNNQWQAKLATLGSVRSAPLLEITPLQEPADTQQIKNRILDLDLYQHVIFVSQNAVHHGFDWIEQFWPQLPVGIEFYAVGNKTAATALEYGVDASACGKAMNSEALLALPALQNMSDQKVLICRGKGGRPKLAEVLEQRGALVDYCELYERKLPSEASNDMAQVQQSSPNMQHVIPLFSGETLQNLMSTLPAGSNKAALHLIVPAERVAKIAFNEGFTHVFVAQNASEEAMLATTRDAVAALS